MANINTIVSTIEATTGRSDKTTEIQAAVAQALLEIQRRDNHYFMEEIAVRDLVIDKQDYDFPADMKDLKNIYLLDSDGTWSRDPLTQLSFEEARVIYQVDDDGEPEAYTIFRDAFFVWPPKPDDATQDLHLEYYKFLTVITGTQSNEITNRWQDLVEAWATWRFYKTLPNADEEAVRWEGLARPLYEDLVTYSVQRRIKGKWGMRIRTGTRLVSALPRRRRFDQEFGG